jgi:nucleoid-associated protein YgaU
MPEPPEPIALAATTAKSKSKSGGEPTLQHAFLELHEPPVGRKNMKPGALIDTIEFQFNPKELSVGKGATWSSKTQKKITVPQFEGPEPSKLTLEMFLDASDTQRDSVVTTFEKLLSCCVSTSDSIIRNKPNPPWVSFHWGSLRSFTGYIASVNIKYTLFTRNGLPIRGTATITLQEIPKEKKGQNPTSGALSAHRVHTVRTGDTLASIAWHEYGDPIMWRAIATANRIDDPMRLRAGSSLLIPAAEDLPS